MSARLNATASPELLQDRRFSLGEIRLDALSLHDLLSVYNDAISGGKQIIILHHNLHGIYMQRTTPSLHAIYARASWVYVDGLPVIWLARAAGFPFKAEHRITLLDSFGELLAEAERKNWRIFYFGGKEEVLVGGLAKIRELHPSLQITGRNGYARPDETASIIQDITTFKPDVLFIGLGMPLQENWIRDHYSQLKVPVVTTSGATMEYITGHSSRPPAWAGRFGLYGVMRFLAQPRRLWRRYLLEPLVLAPCLLKVVVQQKLSTARLNRSRRS